MEARCKLTKVKVVCFRSVHASTRLVPIMSAWLPAPPPLVCCAFGARYAEQNDPVNERGYEDMQCVCEQSESSSRLGMVGENWEVEGSGQMGIWGRRFIGHVSLCSLLPPCRTSAFRKSWRRFCVHRSFLWRGGRLSTFNLSLKGKRKNSGGKGESLRKINWDRPLGPAASDADDLGTTVGKVGKQGYGIAVNGRDVE